MKIIKSIKDIKGDEIELWASDFENCVKYRPLTDEEFELWLKLTCHENEMESDTSLDIDDNTIESMIKKRILYHHDYLVTKSVLFMLGIISKGIPGRAVMLINYFQYKAKKLGINKITTHNIWKNIFPDGIPEDKSWGIAWSKQKICYYDGYHRTVNMLDFPEFCKSIRLSVPSEV